MSQLGRISGQLLKDNLTREGTDLKFDTDLLYLNVNARYIGANTDTPSKSLFVNGEFKSTDFISLTGIEGLGSFNLDFTTDEITSLNDLNLVAANFIFADNIKTDNISIDNNGIVTLLSNSNLELRPDGTGTVEIQADVNITGSLTATGNITLDGNITFGSDSNDTITFGADVNSDIIPDVNEYYTLGSNPTTSRWKDIHPSLINGQLVTGLSIVSGGLDLVLRPGNIWYVAANGSDSNVGNHQSGPFATIAKALFEATSGDTVLIYPGTFTEITPLTVPVGVTVKGTDLRSVNIVPDSTSTSENVFLLNGETTVSDITIKNFYYDSVNDTGYAFSFAPGFTVSSRSPYIQNITVLTQGTTLTVDDPRGFASGDAGRGAKVDGSLATAVSKEASMLFHSVTFITPGVDALVMTNGVRVEWLNSFSYFANRGMYATNGTLGLASLGIRFGAEIRSIGSANVYGNYGAEADGPNTLMYLITHNFAYIGAGKDTSNDPSLNIAANETIELGGGRIYYQSLDNKGNFKVGDAFGVSFETGLVAINGVSVSAGGITSINFAAGTDETVIDATQISVNNIKFSGNTLSSLSGNIELDSHTNELNVSSNVYADKNINVDGDFTVDGELTIGNAFIDVVEFVAPVDYGLRAIVDNVHSLGNSTKRWADVVVFDSYIGNLKVSDNVITTLDSNADLELRADGTGRIYSNADDTQFDQNLTVNSTSYTKNISLTGSLLHTGNIQRTGNTTTGNYVQTGNQTVNGNGLYDDVLVTGNSITSAPSNANLVLDAAGTGRIYVPYSNVQVLNDFVVEGLLDGSIASVTTSTTAQTYSNSNISIGTNIIQTTVSNSDLELRAAGSGRVYVPQDNFEIDNDLTVNGLTTTGSIIITGLINQVGPTNQIGNTTQTGNRYITGNLTVTDIVDFGDIEFKGNTIATSRSNSNLEFKTSGSGQVYVPSNDVQIDNNLTIDGITDVLSVQVATSTTAQTYSNSNISISTNIIQTTVSNSDLELRAAGSGKILVPQDNVQIDNDLTVNGTTTLVGTNITGQLTHIGTTLRTADNTQVGNLDITGQLTVSSNVDFGDIEFIDNRILTTESNSNLELKTSGSGKVYVPNNNVKIDNDLVIAGLTSSDSLTSTTSTTSQTYSNSNISIGTNVIETTVSNSDLELRAAGTGRVYIPQGNVKINNDLTVDGTTTLANTSITGLITHIGNTSQTGNILQTGNKTIIGRLTVTDNIDFGEIEIKGNTISTSTSNSNLELKTSGSGEVYVPSNDVQIDNDLVVAGLTSSDSLTSTTSTTSQTYSNSNISIGTNIIETTVSNSDLELRAAGTGRVYISSDNVKIDNDLTVDGTAALANTSITGSITHAGNYNQTGSSTQTGNRTITGGLTVIGDVDFGDVEFKGNTITTTRSNSNLELSTSGSGQVIFNDAVLLNQSANITTLVTNGIGNSGTITSEIFTNTNIEIQDNNIKTTSLNSDLILLANNTGIVSFPLDPVVIGQDFTVTLSSTLKNTTIVGPLTHAGLTTQVGSNTQTGILDITGDLTVTADAYLENVNIINNRITTVASNSNLELKAIGSGIVRINDSAAFGQQLTVNGVTTTNSITSSGTITSDQFKNDDILIDDNYITTTNSNSNLVLSGEGTGGAKLEKIKFNSSTINTDTVNEGITLSIPSNSLTLNAATALKVPVGTTVNRPTLTQGEFRFNTTDSLFRGFSSSKVSFAGVYSENLQTKVLAHPTNNTLLFTANNILAGTISSTGLVTNGLLVDNNLLFDNSTISSTTVNSDIVLLASGTGYIKIANIAIEDNEFLNLNSTQPIILENTNSGYVKFAGTAGLAIPVGDNDNRPSDPETGDMRWNTEISTAEVFNGIAYQTLSGDGGDLLNAAQVQEVTNLWALVLG